MLQLSNKFEIIFYDNIKLLVLELFNLITFGDEYKKKDFINGTDCSTF